MLCRDVIRCCVDMPSDVVWRCHQMLFRDAIRCWVEMPSDVV